MYPKKRIAAAFMAVLFCASAVVTAGCGKNVKSTNETISETDEWYSIQKYKIGEQYIKDKEIEFVNADFIGIYEGNPVYYIDGYYLMPEDYDPLSFDYNSLNFDYVDIYGEDGSLEKSIDVYGLIKEADLFKINPDDYKELKEEFLAQIHGDDSEADDSDEESGDDTENVSTGNGTNMSDDELFEKSYLYSYWSISSGIEINDNKISVPVYVYMPGKSMMSVGEDKNYRVEIDINTEKILSCNELQTSNIGYTTNTYDFEGYKVKLIANFDPMSGGNTFYEIEVIDPDGERNSYNVSELIKEVEVDFVYGLMYLGDGKALAGIQTSSYDQKVYECDLKTGSFKEYQKDVSALLIDFYMATYINGIGNIIIEDDGIKKLDIDNNSKTTLFSFDSCNINRFDTQMMSLLTMTDDKIYITVNGYSSLTEFDITSSVPTLYILSKEDKNPNAGKTVLRATVTDNITAAVAEAVCVYNDTNSDYYIRLTDEYSLQSKVRSGEYSWDDADADEKSAQIRRDLAYQLLSDLKNGDGPDLIFGYGVQTQLNNDDYLLDLKSEVGTEGLFENIVEASETNGKIYQYPLAFVIEGLLVDKDDVAEDQTGFTFEQYKDFVSGVCNGEDPIDYSQLSYFNICFQRFADKCFNGKKVDFGTDDYRMLAEYVAENVTDRPEDEMYFMYEPVEYGQWNATLERNISIYQLMTQYADSLEHIKIMGTPSVDGTGPSLSVTSVVGVSAHTSQKEACVNFVKALLGDTVQTAFAEKVAETPVSKAAFEATAKRAIVDYNFVFEKNLRVYGSEADLRTSGMPWHRINPSFVDTFEEMIDSCSGMVTNEPGLALIIDEEMPAYFTGQKSLDDVIKVIENRAQTMFNERG